MFLPEGEVDFRLRQVVGIARNTDLARMVGCGSRHDLHQPARAGGADHAGSEVRFLQCVGIGERRIDFPTIDRGPARCGIAQCRFRTRTARRVVRHPQLGRRQAEFAGKPRKLAILGRIADPRLMAQHFVGKVAAADFRQRDCGADIGHIAQRLPVRLVEIGGRMLLRNGLAQLFEREHAVQGFIHPCGTAQLLGGLFRLTATHQRAARPVIGGGRKFGVGGTLRRTLEIDRGTFAIVEPPRSQPGNPVTFGNPRARTAFRYRARHAQRGGVLVLDVIAPRNTLAPFGARFAA